ncbi:hypothetical protein AB2D02_31075, partial [Pseudomonas aeruginosa]
GNKISNPPWVKFQSAGWVNFPSAPTAQSFLGQFPLLPKLFNHQPKRFIQFHFCCLAKGTMKPFRGRMSYAVYSLNVDSHRCSPPTGMPKSRSRQYLGSLTNYGALLSSSSIVPGFA